MVVVEINNGQEKLDEGCTNKKMGGVQTKQTTDGCTFPLRPNKGRATKIESNNSLNQNKNSSSAVLFAYQGDGVLVAPPAKLRVDCVLSLRPPDNPAMPGMGRTFPVFCAINNPRQLNW